MGWISQAFLPQHWSVIGDRPSREESMNRAKVALSSGGSPQEDQELRSIFRQYSQILEGLHTCMEIWAILYIILLINTEDKWYSSDYQGILSLFGHACRWKLES